MTIAPGPATDEPLSLLLGRRSTSALTAPGPTPAQLDLLLQAAATVPDHGNLRPWRLVFIADEGRNAFGDALARAAAELSPDLPDEATDRMRQKAFAAPAQLLIISSPKVGAKVAEWEQLATAACTGFAVVIAAHALGLGAIWKSVPFTRAGALADLLEMSAHEQLLGWVNLGTAESALEPRGSVDPSAFTTVLRGAAPTAYDPAP